VINIEQTKAEADQLMGKLADQLETMAKQLRAKAEHLEGETAGSLNGMKEQLEGKAQLLQSETARLVKHDLAGVIAVSVVGAVVVIAVIRFLATGRRTA
jgi:hypothetical protein